MNMTRAIRFAALASVLAMSFARAAADPASPSPNVYRSLESHAPRDAGVVQGTIESVDYSGQSIRVRGPHGTMSVAVVPSTTIYRGREYAAFSDLRGGQVVEIALYEVGGRLVAQSIRLK